MQYANTANVLLQPQRILYIVGNYAFFIVHIIVVLVAVDAIGAAEYSR